MGQQKASSTKQVSTRSALIQSVRIQTQGMSEKKEKVFTAGSLDAVNAAHPHMVRQQSQMSDLLLLSVFE